MKVNNNTKSVLHIGAFSLQPGLNEVEEGFSELVNASTDFIKQFVAGQTDFVPSGKIDTTKMTAANAIAFIEKEADVEVLKVVLNAEAAMTRVRKSVVEAVQARIGALNQAAAQQAAAAQQQAQAQAQQTVAQQPANQ